MMNIFEKTKAKQRALLKFGAPIVTHSVINVFSFQRKYAQVKLLVDKIKNTRFLYSTSSKLLLENNPLGSL